MTESKQHNYRATKEKVGKKAPFAVALVVLGVLVVMGLIGGKTIAKNLYVKLNTPYIDLVLPLELEDVITDDESTYGTIYTRAFYMNYGGEELPLWRLDFGDPNAGDWVGMLKTDKGDVPVVMTGFAISDEELSALGEEGSQLYGKCMQGYSVMLDGIMSDPRFTAERPLAVGKDTDMKLTYWNVTLPDTMKVSEKNEGGNYEAVFFGGVLGEMVPLYRVCIGEEQAESFLGYFEIDGVQKPISVGSFDLLENPNWSTDDYSAAYRMMDTINDVIQQITSSEHFSESLAE